MLDKTHEAHKTDRHTRHATQAQLNAQQAQTSNKTQTKHNKHKQATKHKQTYKKMASVESTVKTNALKAKASKKRGYDEAAEGAAVQPETQHVEKKRKSQQASPHVITESIKNLIRNVVEEKTRIALYYFDKNKKADEEDLKTALGKYIFSEFKLYQFVITDDKNDIGHLTHDSENLHIGTANVTFNGTTLHNIPTIFFHIYHKNLTYASMTGIRYKFSKELNVFAEGNYIHVNDVPSKKLMVRLVKGKNHEFEKVNGDDVGSNVISLVQSFLQPQNRVGMRFNFIGHEASHPLPPSARKTILVIPLVKKLYVKKMFKKMKKKKNSYRVFARYTYAVRTFDNDKNKYGPPEKVTGRMLKCLEPFLYYRKGYSYRTPIGTSNTRIGVYEDFDISLCNEDGNNNIPLHVFFGNVQTSYIINWLKCLFVNVEFAGFVNRDADIPN